MTNKAIKL